MIFAGLKFCRIGVSDVVGKRSEGRGSRGRGGVGAGGQRGGVESGHEAGGDRFDVAFDAADLAGE